MLSSPLTHQETHGDMCFESMAQCSTMCVLLAMSLSCWPCSMTCAAVAVCSWATAKESSLLEFTRNCAWQRKLVRVLGQDGFQSHIQFQHQLDSLIVQRRGLHKQPTRRARPVHNVEFQQPFLSVWGSLSSSQACLHPVSITRFPFFSDPDAGKT